jgi:IS5 family transposase
LSSLQQASSAHPGAEQPQQQFVQNLLRVETVFAVLKQRHGYRRIRYLGLIHNQFKPTLLAIRFNLRRMMVLSAKARTRPLA